MDVRNCRKCGKLFNYVSGQHMCPNCRADLEKLFQEVKSYVRDNKNASLQQISDACNVETSQIQQWIREERLEFTLDSPIKIPCETCGATIRSGRYCDKCKQSMANGFNSVVSSQAKPVATQGAQKHDDHQKMRFLKK